MCMTVKFLGMFLLCVCACIHMCRLLHENLSGLFTCSLLRSAIVAPVDSLALLLACSFDCATPGHVFTSCDMFQNICSDIRFVVIFDGISLSLRLGFHA